MKTILTAAATLALSTVLLPAGALAAEQTFSAPVKNDVLSRMFIWWNQAIKDPNGFTVEAFSRYFTDDAVLRINGTNRAAGIQNLTERFRMIQKGVEAVEIKVPFVEAFSSPDGSKIFTYHLEEAMEKGKASHSMVMGYAEIRDGKIALVNFISIDGQPGPIAGK